MIQDYNRDPNNILRLINNIDTRGDNKPATNISWNEAARFVNWLNEREGEQPAYRFDASGVNDNITLWDSISAWQTGGENRYRHKNTKYFIPTEDEWYKAAYYDPNTRGYYNYPGGSNTAPTAIINGTGTNTAVYTDSGSGINPTEPADINQAGGLSPFGTIGQGGNVYEWNESAYDGTNDSVTENRTLRGGSFNSTSAFLSFNIRTNTLPTSSSNTLGFRIAYAPVGTGDASPEQLFTFVDVGDAGNADYVEGIDWTSTGSLGDGKGGVDYDYQISKFAVKVCDIDVYNTDPINATRQITVTNTTGFNNNPAVGLTWNNCARFVNWLNEKEGEQPAYNFTTGGVNDNITVWDSTSAWQNGGENLFRHKNAKYFIPSEDEWIKAAFYDPNYGGAGVGGYHRYPHPTGNNNPPASTAGGTTPNTAVWRIGSPSSSNDFRRAGVDFAGGLSYYGTMGQSGNSYEYLEATDENYNATLNNRTLRGGTAGISSSGFLTIDVRVGGYYPYANPGPGSLRVARAEVGTGEDPA